MLTPGKDKGIANPLPLGLACLAITTFLLGFGILFQGATGLGPYFCAAACFGGIVEVLAGMWGFAYGDTLAATLFSFAGALYFWLGLMHVPALAPAMAGGEAAISTGMVLLVGGVVIFYLWIASFAESAVLNGSLLFLWISWALLGIGLFGPFRLVSIAGGAAAIASGLVAAYGSFARVFNDTCRQEVMPVGIPSSVRDRVEREEVERISRLHPEAMRVNQSIRPQSELHS